MNAKERFYSGLAKETIGKITSNTDNWTSFLRTMSRNYEFTYPEQVMIYAQRPNATFCKPYEDWNAENYRRYVKRGSTGIALFVMNRDKPYLRYVFDVADTGVRRSSPELKPWEVTPENRSYVMEAMERTFGVAADGVLEAQLEDIASALAAEYWDDYKKQFLDIVANSFLEEYDELNIEVAFKNAVANSVSYTMYCRFVESPDNYFEHEDFQKVFDFNTRQTVNALGTAVNAISTRMFQEIEKAIGEHEQIKATERSTDYERDDLQTGRRLSDSEPSVGERGRETSGQVRQDASSIFGTEQSDAPERHDSDGEPVPAPVGDRGNSESQSGVSDGAVPEGQPRTGQGNAADGVGAAHEQPESTGGGSRDDGAYQQLSLNLFLSENEQISFIDRAESFTPSAFSFAQEEIDHFLLLGSNTDEARKVVALEYMKQKPLEEIVQTLKQVYHGGYGLKEDSGNICAWYAEDGMPERKPTRTADLDYFYGQSSELFSFYRIPKLLFQDSRFQPLSTDAKTLYGILLDRMSLSARNGWLDKAGRVFIIYTVQEVQDSLGCADKKATKLLRELEEYGLIERKRRGLGKPDLIYVKNFSSESSKLRFLNRDNDDSGVVQNTLQDPAKLRCNKTERNNTEISDTDPIYSDENDWMSKRAQLEEYFSQSLEVELLLRLCPDDEDTIYQIVDLLVDTCATSRKLLHIAGDDKPAEVVRSRFMKLNADHICFVLKCLAENSNPIRNMKQYLLASLYNAPTTMQLSYQNQTNHDLANRR